jgi:hypothetical protein
LAFGIIFPHMLNLLVYSAVHVVTNRVISVEFVNYLLGPLVDSASWPAAERHD